MTKGNVRGTALSAERAGSQSWFLSEAGGCHLLSASAQPGSFLCGPTVPVFKVHDRPIFSLAPFERLSALNIVSAMGLGFLLALLIFIDQNIVVSLTNAPENR